MIQNLRAHLFVLGVKGTVVGSTLCLGPKNTVTCAANGDVRLNYNKIGKSNESAESLAQRISERLS